MAETFLTKWLKKEIKENQIEVVSNIKPKQDLLELEEKEPNNESMIENNENNGQLKNIQSLKTKFEYSKPSPRRSMRNFDKENINYKGNMEEVNEDEERVHEL